MYRIDEWFCCLNPVERGVLRQCLTSFEVTLGIFMPCVVFDALWLITPLSREARKAAFLEIFGMTETEMVIVPDDPAECVYTFDTPAFWIELAIYTLTPAGACLDGCTRWYPL